MRTLPAVGVVEARQQVDQRRLAAAGAPDDRQALARRHLERDVRQRCRPAARRQRTVLRLVPAGTRTTPARTAPRRAPARCGNVPPGGLDRLVEHLEQALRRRRCPAAAGPATPTRSRSGWAMLTSAVMKPSSSPMLMRPWMASAMAIDSTNAPPSAASICTTGLETPARQDELHVASAGCAR